MADDKSEKETDPKKMNIEQKIKSDVIHIYLI
jgi:hypothetical protein